MPHGYDLGNCKWESKKPPKKKLQLRSRKVQKRYGTVNGVAFHGKIESEEGTEKTPVGKP